MSIKLSQSEVLLKSLPMFRANSDRIANTLLEGEDLVDERTLGLHALNPFIHAVSSPRGYMMSSHLSQAVPLLFGDERITLSGMDANLCNNTFSIKAESDVRVIKVVPRYNVIGGVDKINSKLIIVQNIHNDQLDFIDVPYNFQLHQTFGFKYKWSKDLKNLYPNDIIEKDTILADSPNVRPNGGYAYGINANLALMTDVCTSEDSVIVTRSFAERMAYNTFEKRVIEYDGNTKFPLNLYGDKDNYKPFPGIGEYINEDSVVMCLRKVDKLTTLSTLSNEDLMEYDPLFDIPTYVREPGKIFKEAKNENEIMLDTGKVVDIKVYHNPKSKKETLNSIDPYVRNYAIALKKFYKDILDAVNITASNYKQTYKKDVPMSPRLKRMLMDAQAITNENNNKIKFNHRNENCDTIRVEILIMHTVFSGISSKTSDGFGSKGIISTIIEDHEAPFNEYGRADIIMDPSSIPSRMNVGRLYEQYYNAISRHVKYRVTKIVNGRDLRSIPIQELDSIWEIPLGLTKIIGSEQYDYFLKATYEDKLEILQATLEKEFQILYKFKKWGKEKPKEPYQVCLDVIGTEYEPPITHLNFMVNGVMKTTKEKILLAPAYIILLGRTADNYLAVSSPKVNHFGFAIGISNNAKHNSVGRLNPVRTISETEGRLYVAYAKTPVGPAELSDRAKSIPTHKHIVRNILEAPNPTNIDKVVDRTIVPYGNDSAINLVNNILSSAGIELAYVHDDTVIHNEIKGVMKDEIEAFANSLVNEDQEVS